MGAYNPMSYHNGSVWPHDNAICAAGLMRYGFVAAGPAGRHGLLDAADSFGGRLPELFCGFDRGDFASPVPYPTSCSPQAWAAAAPFLLLRTLLRLDPAVPFRAGVVLPGGARPPASAAGRGAAASPTARCPWTSPGRGWRVDGLPSGLELIRAPAARCPRLAN